MILDLKNVLGIINPLSLILFLVIENYLNKQTNSIFLFKTIIVPSIVYLLYYIAFKFENFKNMGILDIILGSVVSLIDFLLIYFILNCLRQNSLFLVMSMVITPIILLNMPGTNNSHALLFRGCFVFFLVASIYYIQENELGIRSKWGLYNLNLEKEGHSDYNAIGISTLVIRPFISLILSRKSVINELRACNIISLLVITVLYALLNTVRLNNELILIKDNLLPVLLSCVCISIWVLTLNYTEYIFACYYVCYNCTAFLGFITLNAFICNWTRIEYSYALIYIVIYMVIKLLFFLTYINRKQTYFEIFGESPSYYTEEDTYSIEEEQERVEETMINGVFIINHAVDEEV